ncbi:MULTISPECIES: calcium/sodium antiporter [unclassified Colwellia]|uniref:calcium/sodium antiporter n=1 Tax=unclassified Colwellia TaxID=196834 RepID=UPI0015F446E8|nr:MULTISPECIES: calcium/sodium antiporter [unclassified Colwellia]MBA6353496.1 calcium/sodium antiporter [Colwellia sp. BRX9-1]MBA6356275.1 calcium/sodium antiporter [Colwellia sp. BRX8-3]MBA6360102.1 calcium/sodium antiporter [Colwellia sp. BRX8-6]MBA6369591.1 calcium/sodium antiporter [Colwellia sp. BRX8-5]MBA6376230.1 calcium/sodium antiporter [Colwellia sp. BRX8-2]
MNYIMMIAGLLMLIIGGELLIRGAMSAANKLNVSPFLSGLVIVGFGTSMPELIVSVNAIMNNNSAVALGNIMGSNIGNIGLIIGTCGLIAPLAFKQSALKRDAIVMLGAVSLLILIGLTGSFSIISGVVMISALLAYLGFTIYKEKNHNTASHKLHQAEGKELHTKPHKTWLVILSIAFGLGFLMLGAQWFVTGATIIAKALGVSDALIGLTLVAIGTSLPEFTISVMAVLRKHMDVAVANVVGSNIFNILGILGVSSLISPISFQGRFAEFDQWALLFITLVLTVFLLFGHSIGKLKAIFLLLFYVAYVSLGYLYFN